MARILRDDPRVECWGRGIRPLDAKDEVVSTSYYSIAMENIQQDHYFSEKLVDCLVTDTIPLYWGPPAIGEVFDSRGLIQFSSVEQLLEELDGLSIDRYHSLAPHVEENRRRAFELGLTGHETLCQRLAEEIIQMPGVGRRLTPLSRSKTVAVLRKIGGG